MIYANEAAARLLGFEQRAELLATRAGRDRRALRPFDEDGPPLTARATSRRAACSPARRAEPLLVRAIDRATQEERWRWTRRRACAAADGGCCAGGQRHRGRHGGQARRAAQRFLARPARCSPPRWTTSRRCGAVARRWPSRGWPTGAASPPRRRRRDAASPSPTPTRRGSRSPRLPGSATRPRSTRRPAPPAVLREAPRR